MHKHTRPHNANQPPQPKPCEDMASHRRSHLALILLHLTFLVAASFLHPSHSTDCPGTTTTTIIILAGQSNMSGRGGVVNNTWDHLLPPGFQPSESVLRLTASLQWEVARDPLHWDVNTCGTGCGVGPGTPFAAEFLRRCPDVRLGLVPCAIGATEINQWAKGTANYERMVARTKAAVGITPGASVGALLWYQGESDTIDVVNARSYAGKMEKLVVDFREDLQLPNLTVIQVALATGLGPNSYLQEVREQQMSILLPNFYTVDAMGSEVSSDNVHLTTAGQSHLGTLMATAYLQLQS